MLPPRELNIFSFSGLSSLLALKRILTPVGECEAHSFWNSLSCSVGDQSVVPGMVLGLSVADPRLHFPPKFTSEKTLKDAVEYLDSMNRSSIWDSESRRIVSESRIKQITASHKSEPDSVTPIPILILHTDTETYKVIIPKSHAMSFWVSAAYAGCCAVSLRDYEASNFERGLRSFPKDWVSTFAWQADSREKNSEFRQTWQRKPPAKRGFKLDHDFLPSVDRDCISCPRIIAEFWSLHENGSLSGFVHKHQIQSCYIPTHVRFETGTVSDGARIYAHDRVIGFITSAGFSYNRGYGFAIGVVCVDDVESLDHGNVRLKGFGGEFKVGKLLWETNLI